MNTTEAWSTALRPRTERTSLRRGTTLARGLAMLLAAVGCSAGTGAESEPNAEASGADDAPLGAADLDDGSASTPTSNESLTAPPLVDGSSPDREDLPTPGLETDEDSPEPPAEGDDGDSLPRGPAPTIESASSPGPFDVQTFSDGLRDGPDYGSQSLHYPTDAEPPFAAVAVVPGFVSPESSIRAWGPFLASHGIVTLTIGTNGGGDPPEVRANALLDALETIAGENSRSGSPLEGRIDTQRLGVMGWSMGGGGALIAANRTPGLRAAISLAGWSPGAQFSDNAVPTLLFAGTADPLAGGQSQGFFTSIPDGTPKMLYEVQGGNHSVANDPGSTGGDIGRFGLSWLRVFLEGDERYRPLLTDPVQASDFRSNLD
jgi:dienelactone hydrolase